MEVKLYFKQVNSTLGRRTAFDHNNVLLSKAELLYSVSGKNTLYTRKKDPNIIF